MIDSQRRAKLIVASGGAAGPYIMLPESRLDEVRELFDRNGIDYWVESQAISMDGKPAFVVINLGHSGDAAKVQAILDSAA